MGLVDGRGLEKAGLLKPLVSCSARAVGFDYKGAGGYKM